jgi:hypothetical protein
MSDKKSQGKGFKLPKKTASKAKRQKSARPKKGKQSARGPLLASSAKNYMRPLRSSRLDGASARIKGTDFLTAVTIGASNAAAGDVLISQVVNPASLGIARLATMAKLYERYKFRSLKFRYAPVANAQVTGQLIGYVDYDTYDDPTGITGIQNLQRAAAHYGEKPVQVWQGSEKPVFWEIKDVDPMTDLYVDSDGTDPRWTNQGRFVLLAASAIAATTACGNIYLDYDVEFFIPQLEVTPVTGFGDAFGAGGVLSAANPMGTVPTQKAWNNLPISCSTNSILTCQAGTYLVAGHFTGTVISGLTATPTGATSVYGAGPVYAADAKSVDYFQTYTASSSWTLALSLTATTVTAGELFIALIPANATSLSLRKLVAIERASRLLSNLSVGSESILTSLKRSPEMDFTSVASSSSTSSSSSGVISSSTSSGWFH